MSETTPRNPAHPAHPKKRARVRGTVGAGLFDYEGVPVSRSTSSDAATAWDTESSDWLKSLHVGGCADRGLSAPRTSRVRSPQGGLRCLTPVR